MRSTGFYGRFLRLSVAIVPMFGILVLAQTPAPPQGAPAPAAAGQTPPGQAGRGAGTLSSTSQAGADFSPKPPIKAAHAGGRGQDLRPAARLSHGAGPRRTATSSARRSSEFDGNGRMYVAEFVTYMRDADGNNQHAPESRITRFESTEGRRRLRQAHGLRRQARAAAHGRAARRQQHPHQRDRVGRRHQVHRHQRRRRRRQARALFYSGIGLGRDGNLEHEQAGFVWGLDNWIYSTYNAFRFRWTPTGILKEPTGPNGGQWGVTMDDDGKMWFMDAGGERGPMNFQVPIHYGAVHRSRPVRAGIRDRVAGVGARRHAGRHGPRAHAGRHGSITSPPRRAPTSSARTACPTISRGDLLVTEPVGRLIRRARDRQERRPDAAAQRLSGIGVHPQHAIRCSGRSTSPPRRTARSTSPTCITASSRNRTGRGPGSYLRRKIDQYQLDKVIAHGRIWRLRFDGLPGVPATPAGPAAQATPEIPAQPAMALDPARPRMLDETPAQLVAHLSHANGWWRDTAQQLLVQRQDKSVVPALQTIVRSSDNLVARFHALWTLEGLGALDAGARARADEGQQPAHARAGDPRQRDALQGRRTRRSPTTIARMTKDADPDVAHPGAADREPLQAAERRGADQGDDGGEQGARACRRSASVCCSASPTPRLTAAAAFTPEQQEQMKEGETIYKSLCFDVPRRGRRAASPCAGAPDGAMMAPPLAGLAARAGPSRLRHQDAAARHDRSARRPDLHAGHGADGRAERSVDRQHRLVHPQRVRQLGAVHLAGRCRARARGDGRAQGRCGRTPSSKSRCRGCCRPIRRGRRRPATTPSGPRAA